MNTIKTNKRTNFFLRTLDFLNIIDQRGSYLHCKLSCKEKKWIWHRRANKGQPSN